MGDVRVVRVLSAQKSYTRGTAQRYRRMVVVEREAWKSNGNVVSDNCLRAAQRPMSTRARGRTLTLETIRDRVNVVEGSKK